MLMALALPPVEVVDPEPLVEPDVEPVPELPLVWLDPEEEVLLPPVVELVDFPLPP
jgi:hypothetical protein